MDSPSRRRMRFYLDETPDVFNVKSIPDSAEHQAGTESLADSSTFSLGALHPDRRSHVPRHKRGDLRRVQADGERGEVVYAGAVVALSLGGDVGGGSRRELEQRRRRSLLVGIPIGEQLL